ncbi:Golgi SNAP receptor complex member 2 [Frankliniella fusca]|uniref:Golgi SNAP receptor complex member 2 n=1 Tax=Frankliniella fusca TaxID=407009 RepID=A0AAE1LMB6_9NEOP|nr:Golgi SNAP receptor complex member 2 [Frankliniella fusca]
MEALYHQTNILIQETQACFERLNKAGTSNADALENEIQERISTVTKNCERLDQYVYKEPVARRQSAKTRVDQLKYDNHHLQAALRMYQHRQAQYRREETEREELLSRRFTHNSADAETVIFIDHSIQHHSALNNANRGVDDMLRSGAGILESLRDQRDTLKNARRRIIDIANTLGLSNTTMRLIEKRAREDKFVLLGGIFVTLVVILLVIIYLT